MEPDCHQSESDLQAEPTTTSAAEHGAGPLISPPEPKWQSSVPSVFSWHQQQERREALEQELAKTREELQAMQTLLEELPALFEDKFRQRLQPMLEQQQRLLEDNATLRQHLLQLQPAQDSNRRPLLMPRRQKRPRMRQALLHAFGLNGNRAA
jgi:vacuolar-type H+-ATPase subunit I/STV1